MNVVVNCFRLHRVVLAVHHDEVTTEQRNILGTFPKRRNGQGAGVQAVVEVFPEKALIHHFKYIFVGRGDKPGLDMNRLRST
jgi:hypothetical protein